MVKLIKEKNHIIQLLIKNEYHAQIKENEYILENEDNLTNERKEQYQQTIESLNE